MSFELRVEVLRSAAFRKALIGIGGAWLMLGLPLGFILVQVDAPLREAWMASRVAKVALWTSSVEGDWHERIESLLEENKDEMDFEQEEPEHQPDDALTSGFFLDWMRTDARWLEKIADAANAELCWRLVDSKSRILAGNVEQVSALQDIESLDPFEDLFGHLVQMQASVILAPKNRAFQEEAAESSAVDRLCIAIRLELEDGSEMMLGEAFETVQQESPNWMLLGILAAWASLILGLVSAYTGARGSVALVDDLSRVQKQVDQGDLAPRLRRRGHSEELDGAATTVNAILDRLDHAMATLSEVTDNIAHDLRTPLTRLQGQLDLLRRSKVPTPEMIEAVQDEADQLLGTFNALLRIAQVESGSRRQGFRSFDLKGVVDEVEDFYAPAMAEKNLVFECVAPDSALIHGDPDLWMQALSNLLDNALKYTPSEGKVQLELLAESMEAGGEVEIRLRDSGPGIPENEMDKVFQRFYRLASHRNQRGSGLGLSLVAAICELHHAEIQLENRDGLAIAISIPRPASL